MKITRPGKLHGSEILAEIPQSGISMLLRLAGEGGVILASPDYSVHMSRAELESALAFLNRYDLRETNEGAGK